MQFHELVKASDRFGQSTVQLAKYNLREAGATTRRKQLENSIDYDVIQHPGGIEVDINAAFYGAFVDQGVKGHGRGDWEPWNPKTQQAPNSLFRFRSWGPPPNVFRDWIRFKPIRSRNPQTGRFMNRKTSAFLMARSAGRFGLRPTYFMTNAIAATLPKFREEIGVAIHKDTQTFINREIFKLRN
jgi:hypothetical protein